MSLLYNHPDASQDMIDGIFSRAPQGSATKDHRKDERMAGAPQGCASTPGQDMPDQTDGQASAPSQATGVTPSQLLQQSGVNVPTSVSTPAKNQANIDNTVPGGHFLNFVVSD